MQRFFVSEKLISDSSFISEESDFLHQLTKVLRAKQGDQFLVLTGDGRESLVEITEIATKKVSGKIIETRDNLAEPKIKITLFQALPKKPALFEEICQHGTEIGISRFCPIYAERTAGKILPKTERLQKILREAAEQSERGVVPELSPICGLDDALKSLPKKSIVADSYTDEPLLSELLPTLRGEKEIGIFIGPEGGFSAAEIEQLTAAGVESFSLGKRILRTETAGVAVCSALFFG